MKHNFKILQLPIKYNEKKSRKSRGIPTNKIIPIIIKSLLNLVRIKLDDKTFEPKSSKSKLICFNLDRFFYFLLYFFFT